MFARAAGNSDCGCFGKHASVVEAITATSLLCPALPCPPALSTALHWALQSRLGFGEQVGHVELCELALVGIEWFRLICAG